MLRLDQLPEISLSTSTALALDVLKEEIEKKGDLQVGNPRVASTNERMWTRFFGDLHKMTITRKIPVRHKETGRVIWVRVTLESTGGTWNNNAMSVFAQGLSIYAPETLYFKSINAAKTGAMGLYESFKHWKPISEDTLANLAIGAKGVAAGAIWMLLCKNYPQLMNFTFVDATLPYLAQILTAGMLLRLPFMGKDIRDARKATKRGREQGFRGDRTIDMVIETHVSDQEKPEFDKPPDPKIADIDIPLNPDGWAVKSLLALRKSLGWLIDAPPLSAEEQEVLERHAKKIAEDYADMAKDIGKLLTNKAKPKEQLDAILIAARKKAQAA